MRTTFLAAISVLTVIGSAHAMPIGKPYTIGTTADAISVSDSRSEERPSQTRNQAILKRLKKKPKERQTRGQFEIQDLMHSFNQNGG